MCIYVVTLDEVQFALKSIWLIAVARQTTVALLFSLLWIKNVNDEIFKEETFSTKKLIAKIFVRSVGNISSVSDLS